ncbi:MAG: acetylglutamate kinase [Planctomycetes bacterium]|nr:acetylglutamate kinase [Planctomycetota bacterium]MCB9935720.1 acetylglutamate kinase [Planctomycetota bacterium]MCZ7606754.1 acetylglutamate kinase [Planctomycetota bacterium]
MDDVAVLLNALPYLRRYRDKVFVVKVGGEIAKTPDALDLFAKDVAMLNQLGIRIIVIHGGGPQLDEVSDKMGVKPEKIAGRRITDDATLEMAKMVFAGSINTDILAAIRKHGVLPVGLSGLDGEVLTAARRPPKEMTDPETGQKHTVDFKNVGDIRDCNPALLRTLVEHRYVPVLSPLACDDEGRILNINADTVACTVAAEMQAEKLFILTNTNGVLKDINDPESRYVYLTVSRAEELIEKREVKSGMVPKLQGVMSAVRGGVKRAYLINGLTPHSLLTEVFTLKGRGTMVIDDAAEQDYLERG